jgi:hypothetical protein
MKILILLTEETEAQNVHGTIPSIMHSNLGSPNKAGSFYPYYLHTSSKADDAGDRLSPAGAVNGVSMERPMQGTVPGGWDACLQK